MYRVWELDMTNDSESLIASELSFAQAMWFVKNHPEGFPRRIEKESKTL